MDSEDDVVREIDHFDVSSMPKSYTALHIGAPARGKTFGVLALAYMTHHNYAVGHVTCGTESTQGSFTSVFGGLFVTDTFDANVQDTLNTRQIKAVRDKCPHPHSFHILDDIGFDNKNLRNKTVIESIKNGTQWMYRAYHICVHSAKEIHDKLTGFSYIFVYKETDDTLLRLLYRMFFKSYLPEYKDFCNLMADMFDNKFGALVIDTKKQSSKLEECVFIYRPPYWTWPNSDDPKKPRPYPEGWRFGCKQFIDWSDARLNKNYVPESIQKMMGRT